jgi:hypothetical protein
LTFHSEDSRIHQVYTRESSVNKIEALLTVVKQEGPVIFLSPHQDDIAETFRLCGQMEIQAQLLTVFSESAYTVKRNTPRDLTEVPKLRYEEEKSFINAYYPTCDYKTLGYKSALDRKPIKNPRIKKNASEEDIELRNAVAGKIKGAMDTSALIFAPLGLGFHLDHLLLREAALQNICPQAEASIIFYEDLPYCAENSEEEIHQVVSRLSYGLPRPLTKLLCRVKDIEERVDLCRRFYPSQMTKAHLKQVSQHLTRIGRRPAERLWYF